MLGEIALFLCIVLLRKREMVYSIFKLLWGIQFGKSCCGLKPNLNKQLLSFWFLKCCLYLVKLG